MNHISRRTFLELAALAGLCCFTVHVQAQEGVASKRLQQLEKSTKQVTDDRYDLRYKFRPGETVYYEVVHQVAVTTTVKGNTQSNKSRTKSLKKWSFDGSPPSPETSKFTHAVDFVNMWSETEGREPLKYDSRTGKAPPTEYAALAESLGKPISVVTCSQYGKIVDRDDNVKQVDLGTGGLLVPLPNRPVRLKTEWSVPASLMVREESGRYKDIKTRMRYRLEKVEAGVATISVETQVLTPVADARVKSQLIQKLSTGTIKFDIDAGRVISKELDWNETVVGFNGAASNMDYMARMTERYVPPAEVASLRTIRR